MVRLPRPLLAVVLCLTLVAPAAVRLSAQDPVLQPGDLAPDFELRGSDGRIHRLADHKGIRPVVLAWFPKTFKTL